MSLPATMRGIEVSAPGGPEVLKLVGLRLPRPGPGEILIKVAAAGVNRADLMQRAGSYPPPEGDSPRLGLEVAGHVAALGRDVRDWREGDAVCALTPGGGYAEYALAPAGQALPVPAPLDLAQAACLPEAVFTVWSNVVMRAGLQPGERFLVHGGASGIGTTAIQLARLHGARVFASAGTPEKCAACEALGAERAIDYRREDFVEVLRAAGGADVVLDMVGGAYLPRNLRALAPEGRLQMIAIQGGRAGELDLLALMLKRQSISGSTLRAQPIAAKAAIRERVQREVWPWIEVGQMAPVLDRRLPLALAAEAHRHLEAGNHIGKVVLTLGA